MDESDDWFPTHPRLRPGLRVVPRDDGRIQVGLHAPDRMLLPDLPEVAALLRAVGHERRPALDTPAARRWAHELVARGLVVDAGHLARSLGSDLDRTAVLAAYTRPGAAERLEARAAARVVVEGRGPWADTAAELLAEAGLALARAREPASVALVVCDGGEPIRSTLDPWVQVGLPHLVVRNVSARVTVGPFVAPGLTACLRCVDAHAADRDPQHDLVVEHHVPDDDEPVDPLVMRLALAWAVRDVVAYVEGDEPSTWSASVGLDASLRAAHQAWTRHPACGCAWGDVLATG